MMGCIDLKKEFGDVYRLVFEEAYKADTGTFWNGGRILRNHSRLWLKPTPNQLDASGVS